MKRIISAIVLTAVLAFMLTGCFLGLKYVRKYEYTDKNWEEVNG